MVYAMNTAMRPRHEEAMRQKKKVIAIQNVDPALWDAVIEFLQTHKRIPSISKLAGVALETYITLANKYGIDENWHLKLPFID